VVLLTGAPGLKNLELRSLAQRDESAVIISAFPRLTRFAGFHPADSEEDGSCRADLAA
jgi:hypothetical protein